MKKVIVIGGGAAGMMAAGHAALYGANVVLLERNNRLGKKLVITGKGRCNVTNDADLQTLVRSMPGNGKFLYGAFSEFTSHDLQDFLEQHGVPLKVERGNRVFPKSDKSFDVIDGFKRFLHKNRVEIRLDSRVAKLLAKNGSINGVKVNGKALTADAVIICTGGASYPTTGSTGDGYRLAEEVGHTIIPPQPALVPLEVREDWSRALQGLSLRNVTLTLFKGNKEIGSEFGEMLFTHFGISGPIVLTLSRLVATKYKGQQIKATINLKPALTEQQLDARLQRDFGKNIRKQLKNSLDALLPKRLIPIIIKLSGIDKEKPVHQITREEREKLVRLLANLPLTITGTRPLSEAIVTAGGISTKEVNPKTMESKLVSGLYFAGELLDIDGYTGGFNLQAAFSTGYVAGMNAALTSC